MKKTVTEKLSKVIEDNYLEQDLRLLTKKCAQVLTDQEVLESFEDLLLGWVNLNLRNRRQLQNIMKRAEKYEEQKADAAETLKARSQKTAKQIHEITKASDDIATAMLKDAIERSATVRAVLETKETVADGLSKVLGMLTADELKLTLERRKKHIDGVQAEYDRRAKLHAAMVNVKAEYVFELPDSVFEGLWP